MGISRRLPNCEITKSEKRYSKEWHSYIKFLGVVLPGYTVLGYDPGFLMSDGKYDSFTLSVNVVDTLMETYGARVDGGKKK